MNIRVPNLWKNWVRCLFVGLCERDFKSTKILTYNTYTLLHSPIFFLFSVTHFFFSQYNNPTTTYLFTVFLSILPNILSTKRTQKSKSPFYYFRNSHSGILNQEFPDFPTTQKKLLENLAHLYYNTSSVSQSFNTTSFLQIERTLPKYLSYLDKPFIQCSHPFSTAV